jgi:hypothetical protein
MIKYRKKEIILFKDHREEKNWDEQFIIDSRLTVT